MNENITLYGYWRSSAAYRVRIGLNLKQLNYVSKSVHLVRDGGEQHDPQFRALNASELVPVLVDGEIRLNQSLVILQYLDESYPRVSLMPEQVPLRYQALAMAQDIAIEMHPLNNLRVLQYLEGIDVPARCENRLDSLLGSSRVQCARREAQQTPWNIR